MPSAPVRYWPTLPDAILTTALPGTADAPPVSGAADGTLELAPVAAAVVGRSCPALEQAAATSAPRTTATTMPIGLRGLSGDIGRIPLPWAASWTRAAEHPQ